MSIQVHNMSSEPGRTAIDRHAVTAAGQMLMSAIWFEHRVRSWSKRLSMSARPRSSAVCVVRLSQSHQSDRGLHAPASCGR
jgi:hypothetical protein